MIAGRGFSWPDQVEATVSAHGRGESGFPRELEGCSHHQTDVDLVSERLDGSQGETQLCLPFKPEGRSEKKRGTSRSTHCREIQNYIDGMDKLLFGSEIQGQTFLFMSVFQNLYLFTFKKNLKRHIVFSGNEDALQNFQLEYCQQVSLLVKCWWAVEQVLMHE